MMEAQRIDDRDMLRAESMTDEWIIEKSDSDDGEAEKYQTVLKPSPEEISSDPLPELVGNQTNSGEYIVPMKPCFTSLEGTGEFLMKQIRDEWFW